MTKLRTFTLLILLVGIGTVYAQSDFEEKPLTQEEFAVDLVKIFKLEHLLPKAALPKDCVNLLERIGVSPLKGWNPKALLTREDYLVMIGKAQGKEGMVHQRALEVEEKNMEIINAKWQQSYDETGSWVLLEELLSNQAIFPKGAPKSPYGITYKDFNGDHKVDPVYLPAAGLVELREFLSFP